MPRAAGGQAVASVPRSQTRPAAADRNPYKIAAIMDGDMDELTNALAAEHQAELLAALGEQ